MKNPLLTIAIPTYNRARALNFLLQSICGQMSGLTQKDLEVLIFDNASTDDTSIIVESFVSKNSIIKYVKNQENIGPDKNFVKAFNAAKGKYFWMLGDDELLFDGSIPWALKFCKEKEFGCAYLSSTASVFDQIYSFLNYPINSKIKFKRFKAYPFAQVINYRVTFLSGSIVNRDMLIKYNPRINQDIEQFSNSNLVHLTWIFSSILSTPYSYFVTTPIFASTVANSGGYSPVKIFVVNFSEIFGHYFSSKDSVARKFIRQVTLIGWFPKVVFDIRFTQKYKSNEFIINVEDFPQDMKNGMSWHIFSTVIVNGNKLTSFLGVLYLKVLHKITQQYLLIQGKNFIERYIPNES